MPRGPIVATRGNGRNRGATSNPSSSSNRSQFDRFGGMDHPNYRDWEAPDLTSAADVKAEYAGNMDAEAKREWLQQNRPEGSPEIGSAGVGLDQMAQSYYGGEYGQEGAFNRYAEENDIDAESVMEYLYNISLDDFRDFINDPIMRSYYDNDYFRNQFGDVYNDPKALQNMYDTAMRVNNIDNIGTDNENMFSSATNVANAFGTSAPTIQTNLAFLDAYGVSPIDASGDVVTAEDYGITDLGLTEEEVENLYHQINRQQMGQSVLASLTLSEAVPYMGYNTVNELAGGVNTYGRPSDEYNMNNPENIALMSSSLNQIPTFEQVWIFDPEAYAATMDDTDSGYGMPFYGMSDLLFAEGGAAYKGGE